VDFEEIVCYSQTVILIFLAVGYLLNLRNKDSIVSSKIEVKCPSCNYTITDKNVQYCAKCGNMLSHSEGLALEK